MNLCILFIVLTFTSLSDSFRQSPRKFTSLLRGKFGFFSLHQYVPIVEGYDTVFCAEDVVNLPKKEGAQVTKKELLEQLDSKDGIDHEKIAYLVKLLHIFHKSIPDNNKLNTLLSGEWEKTYSNVLLTGVDTSNNIQLRITQSIDCETDDNGEIRESVEWSYQPTTDTAPAQTGTFDIILPYCLADAKYLYMGKAEYLFLPTETFKDMSLNDFLMKLKQVIPYESLNTKDVKAEILVSNKSLVDCVFC